MLAAPYLLFAGICGLMVHAVRKARRDQESSEPPEAHPNDGAADSEGGG